MELSSAAKLVSGITLIAVPSIEYGGSFLLASLTNPAYTANALRQNLFRAGHAHAGVIVILSLVCQVLLDVARLPGSLVWFTRVGAPLAAILISAGFFFSAVSPATTKPGSAILLVYLGALLLGVSVVLLGVGLIRAA
jgi:hypothetical protein